MNERYLHDLLAKMHMLFFGFLFFIIYLSSIHVWQKIGRQEVLLKYDSGSKCICFFWRSILYLFIYPGLMFEKKLTGKRYYSNIMVA